MRAGYVALVGRPNAGKSTLLNALIGTKVAIVSDKPQTTRRRILGVKTSPASQLVFVDTPGVHRPLHRLNVRMVDAALDAVRQVDVVAYVVDTAEAVGAGTRYMLDVLADATAPVVLVLNKIDLMDKALLLPRIDWFRQQRQFADIVPVSAKTGDGLEVLERVLAAHVPEGQAQFPEDYLTDQPERAIVAELVREQVLVHTRDELPFATAVTIDLFEDVLSEKKVERPAANTDQPGDRKLLRLFCSILVDRQSQKPIVIGRGGEMIKRIGTAARQELERFFGTRVFLDLQVKVRPAWREDERMLDDLGVERGRPKRRPGHRARAGRPTSGHAKGRPKR